MGLTDYLKQKAIGLIDSGRPNKEGDDSISPTSSPIDLVGAGLGGMAAKGIVGSLAGDAADTAGTMLARKAALNKMGAGSIANDEASAPIAKLGEEVTKTANSGVIPASDYSPIQPYSKLSDLTGKGTEYYMQPGSNMMMKSVNGDMGLGTNNVSQMTVPTGENGEAIMQGIRDKIAQANQAASPQFGQLKMLMGGNK